MVQYSANDLLPIPLPNSKIVEFPSTKLRTASRTPSPIDQFVFLMIDLETISSPPILMKKIISLNASDYILKLKNFTRGRLLRMPTVREEDVELIDADVATCYFQSELYYSVLEQSLAYDYAALRKVLEGSEYGEGLRVSN